MKLTLEVNGTAVERDVDPMRRLLDFLRDDLGLRGVKEGCGEGECGACTVLLDDEPVLSCLVPVMQCRGKSITTIEAIAADTEARALIERFIAAGATQCGACTPGVVVTAWAITRRYKQPKRQIVREALAGNLCRCTGYEAIIQALTEEGDS